VKLEEAPSCSSASTIVFIGKNSRRDWVAQEQNGLYGGLFANRAQAVKYALFENGHHPETIVELSAPSNSTCMASFPPPITTRRQRHGLSHDKPPRRTRWFSLFPGQT
jgi:hypothetical protein